MTDEDVRCPDCGTLLDVTPPMNEYGWPTSGTPRFACPECEERKAPPRVRAAQSGAAQ